MSKEGNIRKEYAMKLTVLTVHLYRGMYETIENIESLTMENDSYENRL